MRFQHSLHARAIKAHPSSLLPSTTCTSRSYRQLSHRRTKTTSKRAKPLQSYEIRPRLPIARRASDRPGPDLLEKRAKPLQSYQSGPRLPIAGSASDRTGPDLLEKRAKPLQRNQTRPRLPIARSASDRTFSHVAPKSSKPVPTEQSTVS